MQVIKVQVVTHCKLGGHYTDLIVKPPFVRDNLFQTITKLIDSIVGKWFSCNESLSLISRIVDQNIFSLYSYFCTELDFEFIKEYRLKYIICFVTLS